jgi:hypothetical protein
MNDSKQTYIYWDAHTLAWFHEDHGLQCEPITLDDDALLPALPEGLTADMFAGAVVLLPQESLLLRTLHLPLKSPSMLDGDMLLQELADHAGIDPEDWWLCWSFHNDADSGIHGTAFGMPETLRQTIADDNAWQQLRYLGIDGWHRVQAHIAAGDVAVLDQDADGLFLALHSGACWRGIRRLNGAMDAALWAQVCASLQAMGFDAEQHAIRGQIDAALATRLQAEGWQWQGEVLDELLPRYHANLRCLSQQGTPHGALNFRHGRWAAGGSWQALRPWLRSASLAAALLLLMIAGMVMDNANLKAQQSDAEARLVAAFKLGLPQEPVMLDPLAQLRQAAANLGQGGERSRLLNDIQHISEVYQSTPWQLKTLSVQQGKVQLAGEVADVQGLNTLQSALEQALAVPVRIADTNLGSKVAFRLEWLWQ